MTAPLDCKRCPLHKTRTHVVNARGNPDARVLLIGEAPGAEEDACGLPFVGRSGKLLDEIIAEAGVDVRIENLVRCRPPGNRRPTREEIKACSVHLHLRDENVALGRTAGAWLAGLPQSASMADIESCERDTRYATYHPGYVLRGNKFARVHMVAVLRTAARRAAVLHQWRYALHGPFPWVEWV